MARWARSVFLQYPCGRFEGEKTCSWNQEIQVDTTKIPMDCTIPC